MYTWNYNANNNADKGRRNEAYQNLLAHEESHSQLSKKYRHKILMRILKSGGPNKSWGVGNFSKKLISRGGTAIR